MVSQANNKNIERNSIETEVNLISKLFSNFRLSFSFSKLQNIVFLKYHQQIGIWILATKRKLRWRMMTIDIPISSNII